MKLLLRSNSTNASTFTPQPNNRATRRKRSSLPPPIFAESEVMEEIHNATAHGRNLSSATSLGDASIDTARPAWNRNDEQTPSPTRANPSKSKSKYTPRSPQDQEAWLAKWRDPEPVVPTVRKKTISDSSENDVFRDPRKSPARILHYGETPKIKRRGTGCSGLAPEETLVEHLARCEFLKCSYVNVGYDFEAFKSGVIKSLEGACPFETSSKGNAACKCTNLTGETSGCPHRKCFFFGLGCVFMGTKEEVLEHIFNHCPVFLLGGTIADLQDQVTSRDSHIRTLTRTISNLERQLSKLHVNRDADASSFESVSDQKRIVSAMSYESLDIGRHSSSMSKESVGDLSGEYASHRHGSVGTTNFLSPTRRRSFLKKTFTFLSRKRSVDIFSSTSNASSTHVATDGPLRSPSKRSSTMKNDPFILPTTKKRRTTPPTISSMNSKDRAATVTLPTSSMSASPPSTPLPAAPSNRRRKALEDIFPGSIVSAAPRTAIHHPDDNLIPDMERGDDAGLSISSQPVFVVSPTNTIAKSFSRGSRPLSPSDSSSSFRSVSDGLSRRSFETDKIRSGTPATSHHSSSPYLDDELSILARGSSTSFETAVSTQTVVTKTGQLLRPKEIATFAPVMANDDQEIFRF